METPKGKILKEMLDAFNEIQMPRTPYVLEDLIVNTKHTDQQKYAQCVLELSIAYDNLRVARIDAEIKEIEIEELVGSDKKTQLEKEKKQIELEQLNRARLGSWREFSYLFELRKKFEKNYTREELNEAQPLEYEMRLKTQALHDVMSKQTGISSSNLEGLRQANISPERLALPAQRDEIEKRYLEEGKLKALIIIPSKDRMTAQQVDELLSSVELPTNVEFRIENIHSSPVADNYNVGFEKAIQEGCTHIVTLEDDQVLERDSIIRLFDFALDNPDCCVGAWYCKRQKTRQGVHITLKGGHRTFLEDDGEIHEVKTLAMGLSIYPTKVIQAIDFPYCKTTDSLSQDSYLSQKIRDKGYRCLVDTSIKIGHKDRDGTIYS